MMGMHAAFDFEAIAQDYDAIHLTHKVYLSLNVILLGVCLGCTVGIVKRYFGLNGVLIESSISV